MSTANPLITAIASDFAAATIAAVSEATNYTAINALDFLRPRQIYKGTGAIASERLVLDFGATTQLDGLVLLNSNCGAITVAGNASDSWGAPSYADAALVGPDASDAQRKAFVDLSQTSWASVGYRYLALIPIGVAEDGSGVLKLGGVLPLLSFTTWAKNPNPPYGRTAEDSVRSRGRLDGGVQHASLGPVHTDLTFELRVMTSAQDNAFWALQSYGRGSPIVVYRNMGDTSEVYVGHRQFTQRHDERGPNQRSAQPLVVRTVV